MPGIEKLSPSNVARLKKPGKYNDGGGLYLQVSRRGIKSWIFRYERQGEERCMGLGAIHAVSIGEARNAASKARARLAQGIDPLQDRMLNGSGEQKPKDKTFDECVAAYVASHRSGWKSAQHARQWERQLQIYISPSLGRIHVRLIETAHIVRVLEPIWVSQTETATRLRGRIERVLSWATVSGYREGENPARWRGHLQVLLPAPAKLRRVHHHAAMPYEEISAFYERLCARKGKASRALAFIILTACRSNEVLQARWEEIDFERAIWTIPPERMKNGHTHRVPLVGAMLEILRRQQGQDPIWVFPGRTPGKPLTQDAILAVLHRMVESKVTVHGFRSSFRVWAAERTEHPKEVPELALAHAVGSLVELAYQRSDLIERRRALMQEWCEYCQKTQYREGM